MSHTRRSFFGRSRRQPKRRESGSCTHRRLVQLERLEDRVLLAADVNPWHNPALPRDVNGDYQVSALDALIVVNALNEGGPRRLGDLLASNVRLEGESAGGQAGEGESSGMLMFDVNNDQFLSPMDALNIVNALNSGEDPPKLVKAEVLLTENVPANGTTPVNRPLVTTVAPGTTVLMNVYVEDIRTDDGVFRDTNNDGTDDSDEFGVFAAYFDVMYDTRAFAVPPVSSTNPIIAPPGIPNSFNFPISQANPEHLTTFGGLANRISTELWNYGNGPSGQLDRANGVFNEIGGFTGMQRPYGKQLPQVPTDQRDVFLNMHVFDIPLEIQSVFARNDAADVDENGSVQINVLTNDGLVQGNYSVTMDGADLTAHQVLTFGDNNTGTGTSGSGSVVPEQNILFVGATINVPQGNRVLQFDGVVQNPAKGTVAPGANGVVTYTPNAGQTGPDTFVYRISDSQGSTKLATVSLNIIPLNDPPNIAAPASVSVDEGSSVSFTGSNRVSISDTENDPLSVTLTTSVPVQVTAATGVNFTDADGSNGTLAFSGTPAQVDAALAGLTMTPASEFYGSLQLVVTANDAINATVTRTVPVTVRAVNDPPTLTIPGDQTVQTNQLPLTVTTIRVGDALDAQFAPGGDVNAQLSLTATGGTLTVVAPGGLAVTGNGTSSLSVTGLTGAINTALIAGVTFNGAVGNYTVTAVVSDLGNVGTGNVLTVQDSFQVTVVPPTRPFAVSDMISVLEDSSGNVLDVLQNDFNFDSQQGGANLNIIAVSTVANGTVVNNGNSLTYTPNANFFQNEVFTYTIEDTANSGDGPSTATVTVSVTGINDQPSFTASNPADANEDAGPQSLLGWASFDPGQPNEAAQQVLQYLVAAVSNPALFAAGPSVSPSGTLSYTTVANASGSSTFTVAVQDNGGTENGGVDTSLKQTFTLTVHPVNDRPTFTASHPAAVNEDSGPHTLPAWASNFSPGPADEAGQQLLGYTASVLTNPGLFAAGGAPTVGNDGTLNYTLAADAFGTATFAVTARDDGGTDRGGLDTSTPQTFTVTVNGVNDAPTFNASNPAAVTEDAGPQTVANWASNFSPGPANEATQQLVAYTVSGVSNPGLFATAPAVANNGTLTYTPAPDAAGTSTFVVRAQDNGGTANGGVDLSAPRTLTITVNPVNDAPVNRINGSADFAAVPQSTDDNVDLAFSAANGNLLSVTDVDDNGSSTYSANLSVTNGTLLLGAADTPAASKAISGTRAEVNAALASLIFRPETGFIGTAVLSVASSDGGTFGGGATGTDTDQVTIAVAPINDPPIAADDQVTTSEGAALDFNVFVNNGNGADSAGPNENQFQEIEVISVDTAGTLGQVTLVDAATGAFRYVPPDPNFNGVTTFRYTIQDNGQSLIGGNIVDDFKTDIGTVTITVTEVNDAPTAADDLLLTAPQPSVGQQFSFSVSQLLDNDTPGPANESGQTLRVVAVSTSAKGAPVSLDDRGTPDPADDLVVYTIPAGFDHIDTFTYTVSDNGTTDGASDPQTDTATVTVRDVVLSTISGYVYLDGSSDGVMNAGDVGLGGVRIELSGTDITGGSVLLSTRTDDSGYYEFSDLLPSQEGMRYRIRQVGQPMGFLDGPETGGNGGANSIGNDAIEVFLPLIGFDPENPEDSATRNNNFAELALTAQHTSIGLSDLLHSDGNNGLEGGWLFGTDAGGQLQWYVNLGLWDNYIPGQESSTDAGSYQVAIVDGSLWVTDSTDGTLRMLSIAPQTHLRQSAQANSTVTRIIGGPELFGLPAHSLAAGEGESPVSEAELDSLTGGDFGDYSQAVDAVFADLAGATT